MAAEWQPSVRTVMTVRTFRDAECLGRLYNQCEGLLEEDATPLMCSELKKY